MPCRNCVPPKRKEACHDVCPEYLEKKAKMDDARKNKVKFLSETVYERIKYSSLKKKYNK